MSKFLVYILGMFFGLMCGLLLSYKPPTPVAITRAVAFESCGSMAGILVIASDGSSQWYQPPEFPALRDLLKDLPDAEKWAVSFCPKVST